MSISQNLVRIGARQLSTTVARSAQKAEVPKGYFGLRNVQERFQAKDGKPIFLKGGAFDSIMYRITMGLSLVGMGGILKLFYDLAVPSTPSE